MLNKGDTIGPYVLIKKLGEGTFGVVWLAERGSNNPTIQVALKLPKQIDLKAILKEAVVWAQVGHHSNVLPIIEADVYSTRYGDQTVIVSPFMPGSIHSRKRPMKNQRVSEKRHMPFSTLSRE